MRIVIYQKIVRMSGTYTFDKNFIKTFYKDHELVYVYEAGDLNLIEDLKPFCETIKNDQKEIHCDICIYSSLPQAAHLIKAKEYWQMLHTDLAHWKVAYKPVNIDKHVAVGQNVADSFKASHGLDAIIIPNLLSEPKIKKVLRLVTASRISKGKGFERMIEMAVKIREAGIPFTWEIYGTGSRNYTNKTKYPLSKIPNVVFMGVRNNVQDYMVDCDFVVQLSDNEGFCYSIYEALQVGTPVIVTNWEGVDNIVKNGVNGFILDMDLENLDIEKIYTSRLKPDKLVSNTKLEWEKLFDKFNF